MILDLKRRICVVDDREECYIYIGSKRLLASSQHIYMNAKLPKTYDYLPWNLLNLIICEAGLEHHCMLDIGANIGDSLAHFRRHSSAPVICVEPSERFFSILEINAADMGDVELINALVAPDSLVGQARYAENNRTGWSRVDGEDEAWGGKYVTPEQLLNHSHEKMILKTDTDGFDCEILLGFLDSKSFRSENVPIIFFEGPEEGQMRNDDMARWLLAIARLQEKGYGLTFITNRGAPVAYAGTDVEAARSIVMALVSGLRNKYSICHYFDVIAVHKSVRSTIQKLQDPLPESLIG